MKNMGKVTVWVTVLWLGVMLVVLLPGVSRAIPQKINYQGYLTNAAGVPVNGTVQMVFSIYNAGGTALWTETQNVPVASGVYNVNLGEVTPITLAFDVPYYLGVRVGTDPEMTPRKALTSVGYAFRSVSADHATYAGMSDTATSATTANSATTATNFSGTLAGDVTGTQNTTTVTRIQNYPVSSTTPSANQVLRHNGSIWTPSAVNLATDTAGTLPISKGGTGSSTQNFVDLSTTQSIDGTKSFTSPIGSTVATGTPPFQVNSTTMVTNLNAEMVGGQRLSDLDTLYQRKYSKVGVVEPSGHGDYTNPATAMADSANWCGLTPSRINPCLLKIMPGFYDVGENFVQMKEYIDIEGSGENVTILSGTIDAQIGVVNGASNAEIRFLTVENKGGSGHSNSTALSPGNASPKITNVTITASGGSTNYGVHSYMSFPTMTNVTVTASGGSTNYGVYNTYSSPTMTNATITVSEGGGYNYGVYNTYSSPTMTNITVTVSGGYANYGVYNNLYLFSPATPPTMTNVIVTVSGGSYNYGVDNFDSPPTMTNVTVVASGASNYNYGIYNEASSAPKLMKVTANGSGGIDCFGFFNANNGGEVTIDHSYLSGQRSVRNDSAAYIYVGSTKLHGGVLGNVKCAGVYDGVNYIFYPSSCP